MIVFLSTAITSVTAVSPDKTIHETVASLEELLVFDTKTKTEEIITMTNEPDLSSRSSSPMISAPYTPQEKESALAGNDDRSVIGNDDRLRVSDPSVSPYCKIVLIMAYFSDNVAVRSTGVILGPDLVLTCAHAIYRSEFGG